MTQLWRLYETAMHLQRRVRGSRDLRRSVACTSLPRRCRRSQRAQVYSPSEICVVRPLGGCLAMESQGIIRPDCNPVIGRTVAKQGNL
jgi:hypothetical protein